MRHKCKTPWGWHTDAETCSSIRYLKIYCCDIYLCISFFFPFLFSPHHMSSQTSWSPPPRLWLKCNQLLKLGFPVSTVMLSRWWWWDERWISGARGALNLISTNYPDHGRLPLSRKNAHGRAGNRNWDLVVSTQELWPPSHEAYLCISWLK